MELREGAIIADRFRLMRLLGKGGMGEVWAARHTSLDIPCAVKFIHADASSKPEVRARFEREAKAAAQLRTPNVVQILDYGVFESTPYIAMEYLDGETLNARLHRRQRLDPAETLHIVTGVGKALQKAHMAGIVHRDLKPENIFLVQDIDGETPKVLDFGVAKQSDTLDSNTKTGALLGTPYYMSPEQAQGTKSVDHRADLWSLGVLTFRCLTGELPFKSTALGDLLIKIVTHPIPVPSHVIAGLPPGFDTWWARAAERDPNRRFQSASEMVEALAFALGLSRDGARAAQASHASISMAGGTVVAPFQEGHPGVPFAQSGASQMVPPTMIGHPTPMPVQPGSYPQTDHHGASMAGVTAAAGTSSGGSRRVAWIAVVVAFLGLGGAGAFVAFGGGSDAGEDAAEAAAPANAEGDDDTAASDAPADENVPGDETADETASDDEPAGDGESAGDDESAGDEAAGGAPPTPAPKTIVPRPAPPPVQPPVRSPPTQLDVPKPKPPPKPKPDGFDPGF